MKPYRSNIYFVKYKQNKLDYLCVIKPSSLCKAVNWATRVKKQSSGDVISSNSWLKLVDPDMLVTWHDQDLGQQTDDVQTSMQSERKT